MTEPDRELQERNFIQKSPRDPYAMLYWIGAVFAFLMLIWGIGSWYHKFTQGQRAGTPFLQVTNRDFSVFLWENPEYMRINAASKRGYLPAFDEGDDLRLNPKLAEEYVVASPEIIFRFHVWDRLLSSYSFNAPIKTSEFKEFLKSASEWDPQYWAKAPASFVRVVNSLDQSVSTEINVESLPIKVRRAYWGWSSYTKNGQQVNDLTIDYGQLYNFLIKYPHYQRSYWRNILLDSYPEYLNITRGNSPSSSEGVPKNQITPFLRVALFTSIKDVRDLND